MNDESRQGRSGRWVRRDRRRQTARDRLQKHGATLRRVYMDAVRKRLRRLEDKGRAV